VDTEPSRTAEVVCWMRAAEHLRAPGERIVDDPLARLFLSTPFDLALRPLERRPGAVDPLAPGLTTLVLARHRYLDDALLAALPVDQVVLLGAGYDTRFYRLDLGSARRFEVDHPATGDRKADLIAKHREALPSVEVERVPVDFATQSLADRLRQAGFEAGRKTFWVWEGVTMYLPRAAVEASLHTMRALSGPGSRLALDFLAPPRGKGLRARIRRVSPRLLRLLNEPIAFTASPEGATDLLAACGWRAIDQADADELARRYVPPGRRTYPDLYVVTAEADSWNDRADR
jgi:methyltransferase (TIGR00027 family)